jgi:hypothetical protein
MSDNKPITIATTLNWAFLDKVNGLSGKYQVDLSELSPAAVEAVEMLGIPVGNKADKGDYITAKSTLPIRVYDTNSQEIKGVTVGNGTKAKVVLSGYDWKNPAGKNGISATLHKIVITDMVEYEAKEGAVEVTTDMLDEAL